MNFIFEDIDLSKNFIGTKEKNSSDQDRFTTSPFVSRLITLQNTIKKHKDLINVFSVNDNLRPERYIIPIGVNNNPLHWAGGKNAHTPSKYELSYYYVKPKKSLFSFLNKTYLNDLRSNNAFLLIDSSLEGYHEDWIFDFFHKECEDYNISPNNIIYVTGNSIIKDRYKIWLDKNKKDTHIHPLPYSHFEFDVYIESLELIKNKSLPNFSDHIKYKIENLDNIKLFNSLNKKQREHRVWFYVQLYLKDLLNKGLVSMNQIESGKMHFMGTEITEYKMEQIRKTLPSLIYNTPNELLDENFYVKRIHSQVFLDTWLSVVSETHFDDGQGTIFISEKTFKPIACSHPFIILGNGNSLEEIKKMGYETFSKWIDESYDTQLHEDRIDTIIQTLKDIDKISNKLSWFKDMEETLKYNLNILEYNAVHLKPNIYNEIEIIYNNKTK
jgi:hypothetical protein